MYALCRVFKRSAPGPKIIEHTEQSSDSYNQSLQYESCSSSIVRKPADLSTDVETKWVQFLDEDRSNINTNVFPFQHPSYEVRSLCHVF